MTNKDPLKQGPNAERELFKQFSQMANGFPSDAVIGAAANILLNGIRQNVDTAQKASASWDEMSAKLKGILMAHYDAAGRRKGIFPFHQHIEVPLVRFKKAQS